MMIEKKGSGREVEGLTSLSKALDERGIRERVTANAVKRIIAQQLQEAMSDQHLSKTDMARRMGTSRGQLDRVLDPDVHNVTLDTLARAAQVVGRRLEVSLS